MNPLRVASTHLTALNQLVEEEAATSDTSMNPLRVVPTHLTSLNSLAEEGTMNLWI